MTKEEIFKMKDEIINKSNYFEQKIEAIMNQWLCENTKATCKMQESIAEVLKEMKNTDFRYIDYETFCKYICKCIKILYIETAIDSQAAFMKHKLMEECFNNIVEETKEA